MRRVTKLKSIKKLQRGIKIVSLLTIVTTFGIIFGIGSANVQAETASQSDDSWGPQNRPTFTWEEPADYVTFNSITNNPKMGDERNFVRIRKANTTDDLGDNINLEVGQEYEVWVWFHNNAKDKLNDREYNGVGIATDVRLHMEQPELVDGGTSAVIRGIVSASNANPGEVWDEAFAYTPSTVLLRYVPNSATIHSFGDIDGQILNSEALFGESGAYLGYWNDMWGTLPGCNEYSGYVTYNFVVDQAGFQISKTVAKDGEDNFAERLTAKPGDTLTFKLEYKNTGTINQLNIAARDTLPNGLAYIPGTTYYTSNFNQTGNAFTDDLFGQGVNLGDYEPGDNMSLTYQAKIEDDTTIFPCGDTVIYNDASISTANGTGHDKAEITVSRVCDCATNPEMAGCQELPSTGPVEIAIATIIVGGIGGTGYYFYATRRNLKAVQSNVMGGTPKSAHSASELHGKHHSDEN